MYPFCLFDLNSAECNEIITSTEKLEELLKIVNRIS